MLVYRLLKFFLFITIIAPVGTAYGSGLRLALQEEELQNQKLQEDARRKAALPAFCLDPLPTVESDEILPYGNGEVNILSLQDSLRIESVRSGTAGVAQPVSPGTVLSIVSVIPTSQSSQGQLSSIESNQRSADPEREPCCSCHCFCWVLKCFARR